MGYNCRMTTPSSSTFIFLYPSSVCQAACIFVPCDDKSDLSRLPVLKKHLKSLVWLTREELVPAAPWFQGCLHRTTASQCWGTVGFGALDTTWKNQKKDPSCDEMAVHGHGGRKHEGRSLNLKWWLFLWIKGWSYFKRWRRRNEEVISGFSHPP